LIPAAPQLAANTGYRYMVETDHQEMAARNQRGGEPVHREKGSRRVSPPIGLALLWILSLASQSASAQTGAPCDASKEIKDCRAELSVDGQWLVIKTDTEKCARVEWQGDGMNRSTTVLDGEERLEILIKPPTNLAVTRCVEVKDLRAIKKPEAKDSSRNQTSPPTVAAGPVSASVHTDPDGWMRFESPVTFGWKFRSPPDSPGSCKAASAPGGSIPVGRCEGRIVENGGDVWTYIGNWVDGRRSGYFEGSRSSGDKFAGNYSNGKREGLGTYNFASGARYVGQWSANQKQGQGTFYDASGNRYEGQWYLCQPQGQGTYYFANGDRYEGQWSGNLTGQGTYYFADGGKWTGQFVAGKLHGSGTYTGKDGNSRPIAYDHGNPVQSTPPTVTASSKTQESCGECQAFNRSMTERSARNFSQSYSVPCAKQGYQACLAYAEQYLRREGRFVDCTSACAAESSGNVGASLASAQDCSRNLQSEINRLTDERQRCYSSIYGNPANAFACREIDNRIDALKRDRSNCGTNPDGVSASVNQSRQTDTNILPPVRGGSGSSASGKSKAQTADPRGGPCGGNTGIHCETSRSTPDDSDGGTSTGTKQTEFMEAHCTQRGSNGGCVGQWQCPAGWQFTIKDDPSGKYAGIAKCYRN
jgi:hypothetical protein